jgi:hypothetical protein
VYPFWRIRYAVGIGVLVVVALVKLNFFSPIWNIVVGIILTAALFLLTGIIGRD